MKKIRTSHSQNSMYIRCPQAWSHSYVGRWKSPIEGASLYFGTAIDSASEALLLKNGDAYQIFNDLWKRSYSFGKATQIFDNNNIVFANKDFDRDVLQPTDYVTLNKWAQQLNLTKKTISDEKCIELYDTISKKKKNPYKNVSKEEMKYFNRASWLSMKRKGELMLKSFEEQFIPLVTNVIAVQKRADIKDPVTGDSMVGYIDMIVELEGYDKPIIIDLKTAARPYTQDQLDFSEQLTLYCAMKGTYAVDKTDYVDTDLVGYLVLCKEINKQKSAVCSSCGFTKDGSHRTCNNNVPDPKDPTKTVRCKGRWDEKVVLDPQIQLMVAKKTQEQVDSLLEDVASIVAAMKNGVTYKNTSNCLNWYGSKCPFYSACHENDYSGLVKK